MLTYFIFACLFLDEDACTLIHMSHLVIMVLTHLYGGLVMELMLHEEMWILYRIALVFEMFIMLAMMILDEINNYCHRALTLFSSGFHIYYLML